MARHCYFTEWKTLLHSCNTLATGLLGGGICSDGNLGWTPRGQATATATALLGLVCAYGGGRLRRFFVFGSGAAVGGVAVILIVHNIRGGGRPCHRVFVLELQPSKRA